MREIVDSGNHYVGQVKKNQPKLLKAIEQVKLEQIPIDMYSYTETARGLTTTWSVHLYEGHVGQLHKEWANLNRIVEVHKVVESAFKTTHSSRHYISDVKNNNAAFFHEGIRAHWQIENNVHRTKDIFHKEDDNLIKKKNGPINMSIMSSIAINIHRTHSNASMPDNQIKFRCHLKETVKKHQFA